MKQKRNKFRNTWTVYKNVKYHSKLEATYAGVLDDLKKKKTIKSWERQVRVDCCVDGVHICSLYVDFRLNYRGNHIEYLEVKGRETDVWKLKYKLLKALYPTIIYHVAKLKHLKLLEKGVPWKQVFPNSK